MKYIFIKDILDVLVGIVLLFFLFPLGLVIALTIKIDTKGPVFFKQKRIGKNNTCFDIYKFRTMKTGSPRDVPTHLLNNPEKHITKVGKILRKMSLDELPQIVNVVKLEMSFVGPRPALWNQEDLIRLRTMQGIESFKPGITGWAQINGRDELSIEKKVEYDKYYKDNFSLVLDFKIICLTVVRVIFHKGVLEGKNNLLT